MKRALVGAAVVLGMLAAVTPASAQAVTRESQCTEVSGGNTMTYDCGFNVKNYVMGTPVTLTMAFSCSGSCGPVTSMGMRGSGFTPPGVTGHMVGGRRLEKATDGVDGVELSFVFDTVKKNSVANAHFNVNIGMADGEGNWDTKACKVNVHLRD
jgi:hypothetical protein